jgi:hypothetical protein
MYIFYPLLRLINNPCIVLHIVPRLLRAFVYFDKLTSIKKIEWFKIKPFHEQILNHSIFLSQKYYFSDFTQLIQYHLFFHSFLLINPDVLYYNQFQLQLHLKSQLLYLQLFSDVK